MFCVFFVSMYVLHLLHKWACMGHIKKMKKEEKRGWVKCFTVSMLVGGVTLLFLLPQVMLSVLRCRLT